MDGGQCKEEHYARPKTLSQAIMQLFPSNSLSGDFLRTYMREVNET